MLAARAGIEAHVNPLRRARAEVECDPEPAGEIDRGWEVDLDPLLGAPLEQRVGGQPGGDDLGLIRIEEVDQEAFRRWVGLAVPGAVDPDLGGFQAIPRQGELDQLARPAQAFLAVGLAVRRS